MFYMWLITLTLGMAVWVYKPRIENWTKNRSDIHIFFFLIFTYNQMIFIFLELKKLKLNWNQPYGLLDYGFILILSGYMRTK